MPDLKKIVLTHDIISNYFTIHQNYKLNITKYTLIQLITKKYNIFILYDMVDFYIHYNSKGASLLGKGKL